MKKLLLTSSGFSNPKIAEEFIKILPKKIEDIKILIISYTQNEEEQYYVDLSKQELINLGFENIESLNMNDQFEANKLGDFDVVYVCGGNTFLILNQLKKTGLFEFVKRQVENDAVFVGVSAGSIIAGKDIKIAGWGSTGDKNEINLKDLSGFNFTNIAVFPHFVEDLRSEVEEFKNKVDYPVMEIMDGQALLVVGSEERIIE